MERHFYVDEGFDPESGELTGFVDRERALAVLEDLEAMLFSVGGVLHIAAKRVQDGEIGGKRLYRTVGYFIQWDSFAPAVAAPQPPAEAEALGRLADDPAIHEVDEQLGELEPDVEDEGGPEDEGDEDYIDEIDALERGISLAPEE